ALLLHAEQLGFAQGQLQALALQLQAGRASCRRSRSSCRRVRRAVALAQVGILDHVAAAAPVAGQAFGAGQLLPQ
ncbi:hypothetical protein BM547_32745, partial [Pseudomonas aeruginosa]